MMSPVIWMLSIGFSIAAMIVTAAMGLHYIHMAIAALVSILVALASFQESRAMPAGRAGIAYQTSSSFRYMGLIWTWGALALLATYTFVLQWREWWQFFLGFFVLAGLCLFISATLKKDAEANISDTTMFQIANGLAIAFLIGMLLIMIGLFVHDGRKFSFGGKLLNFLPRPGQKVAPQDWAANNVFFFGALAIAAISCNALKALRKG